MFKILATARIKIVEWQVFYSVRGMVA
jgi:hypothetical protein